MGNFFFNRLVETAASLDDFGAFGGPILIEPSQNKNPIALADHFACWFVWHPHRPSGPSFFQPSVNLVVPRKIYDTVGNFNEKMHVLEDFEFLQRVKRRGWEIFYDNSLAVTHWARATLADTLRHSWRWGLPVRERFYAQLPEKRFPYLDRPNIFWVNLPIIFLSRLRQVGRQSWRKSHAQTLYCFPILAATVFAWAAAVAFGRDQ